MSECKCTYFKTVGLNRQEVVHSVWCHLGACQIVDARIGFAHLGLSDIKVQMDGLEQVIEDKTEENNRLKAENEKLRKMIDLGLGWEDMKGE